MFTIRGARNFAFLTLVALATMVRPSSAHFEPDICSLPYCYAKSFNPNPLPYDSDYGDWDCKTTLGLNDNPYSRCVAECTGEPDGYLYGWDHDYGVVQCGGAEMAYCGCWDIIPN